jgi:hypothetical protein
MKKTLTILPIEDSPTTSRWCGNGFAQNRHRLCPELDRFVAAGKVHLVPVAVQMRLIPVETRARERAIAPMFAGEQAASEWIVGDRRTVPGPACCR